MNVDKLVKEFEENNIELFKEVDEICYLNSKKVLNAFKKYNNVDVPYKIVGRREGDIGSCYADVSYAKEKLEWESKYGIEDMVKDSYNFAKIAKNK